MQRQGHKNRLKDMFNEVYLKSMKNILKATFAIIGTVIGAGFASGQEVYLFFGKYGNIGIAGLFLSCAFFALVIFKTMQFVTKEKISNYQEFLNKLLNR